MSRPTERHAFARALFSGCVKLGLPTEYLIAMLHAPVGDEVSAKAIGRCLDEKIESLLASETRSPSTREAARDRIREAVFDRTADLHSAMCADFEESCKKCVDRAYAEVRRRDGRLTPFQYDLHDPVDFEAESDSDLFRQVFWDRFLDCPPRTRRVVELRLVGFSIEEIVEKVGICRAAVNRILGDVRTHGL